MSSENIKKVYVLNLDKKRIIIIFGIMIIFLGLTFLAGLKWEHEPSITNSNLISSQQVKNSEDTPIMSINSASSENNFLALPEEDNRIFSKNSNTEEDPFLIDPPTRASKEIKTTGFKEKNSDKVTKKKSNSRPVEKKIIPEEKYFTIQLAAFPHEKDALAYKKDLIKKGLDARVDHGKLYYFVRVGKANEKGELDTLYKKIHDTMKIQSVLVQRKIS